MPNSKKPTRLSFLTVAALFSLTAATRVQAQSGPPTTISYDAVGNPTSVTSPSGRIRTSQYDALGRLYNQGWSNVGGSTAYGSTGYGFNGQDALTSVVDPNGRSTVYSRDGFGQTKTLSSPDTSGTGYSYDEDGNLLSRTSAAGQVESYTYGPMHRVYTKTVTQGNGGSTTYTFGYGGPGSGVEAGLLTSVVAAGQSMAFTHESHGRLTSMTQTVGSQSFTVAYSYSNGKLSSMTYPSGRVLTFSRDAAGRIASITASSGGGSTSVVSNVGYTAFGALAGWNYGNGASMSRVYDLNGRMSSVTVPTGTRQYFYDNEDRITGINDPLLGSATYTYDGMDRLTSASTALGSWSYQYDANGNRTSGGAAGRSYTFTADGQTSSVPGTTRAAACGTPLSLNYAADGELTSASPFSAVMSADGLRLQKNDLSCAGGKTTNFVYDQVGHLIGEYDRYGALLQEIVWLGDAPVAVYTGAAGAANYVWPDNLGTPRAVTNTAGQLLWQWDGEPFGASQANSNPAGLGTFHFGLRFPGQYFDWETGFHHNGWREYDPGQGRFVQSDPTGLRGGLNTYAYVANNPLANSDPLGLVDVNNFSPIQDYTLWSMANSLNMSNVFTYAAHMNNMIAIKEGLLARNNVALTADDVANEIQANSSWGHRPVMLLGCHSGQVKQGAVTIAQLVANRLGVPVMGYPDYAFFRDGMLPRSRDAIHNSDGTYTPVGPITAPVWFLPNPNAAKPAW